MSVLEAHRDLLRQELATVHREITAAKQEGQSAESIQQLFDRAEYYADCLRKYTKPAVPDHTGRAEQLVPAMKTDAEESLTRACREFREEWRRLLGDPDAYSHSKCS